MKIIIGLGNPGVEYKLTRHNAGMMLVDKIYESRFMNYEYGFRRKKAIYVYESDNLILVKTAGMFMNESGRIIDELKQGGYFNNPLGFENLYIAHDDLDLKLGEYKIQLGVGPKVHNGVNSIEQALGTDKFWRVRIGIDNRFQVSGDRLQGEEYVLQKFGPEEKQIIDQVLSEVTQKLVS